MEICDRDLHAIAGLWHELAEFPESHTEDTLTHCLTRLASIIGASNAFWVGAAREDGAPQAQDLMHGWRPKAVHYLYSNPVRDRLTADVLRRMGANVVDPHTLAFVARAGSTRAFLREELVDDKTWERSWLVNEALRPAGIESRLVGARAVDDATESYICLDRDDDDEPFAQRERDLLQLFLMGCPAFHRQQLTARVLGNPRLTPRERDVLALLLTDRTEREIGRELDLTWRTTHQYSVSILRKFGVRGRIGLMAMWLRQSGRRLPPPAN